MVSAFLGFDGGGQSSPLANPGHQFVQLKPAKRSANTMRYRSKFVVGLQGSKSLFVYQTLNLELLTMPVVPRSHVVIAVGDASRGAMAVLVCNS